MSKDRPGGMDDKYRGNLTPTQPTPMPKSSMPKVASVASGRVDSGPRSSAHLPRGAGKV